ncbi:mitochondrial sodium/calcium exchanger protein [Drosophila ficusphila]|uniref:mitochondrial sodium/calcium exchanger protein n=1 Tax=Drosophila ficusphila TaxID=30025 RepID=UPI0007E75CF7|nr:mitochondrial sodium/calcium exchanger protein [Drosophila ficusphila]
MNTGTTCFAVHTLPERQRCNFVLTAHDCVANMNLINYLGWHYCMEEIRSHFNSFWSVLGMLLITIYVFWMMQMAVHHYFCPTLKVIADAFRLNESTAGVTILAIANGSPDLFTAIASRLDSSRFSFLACMAQTMFLHTFVAGMVILTRPFSMEPNYYLRDFGFLFLNTAYMDFIHKRPDGITWLKALPSGFIFLGYVAVALIDQHLLKARIRQLEKKQDPSVGDVQLGELKPQDTLPLNRYVIDRTADRQGGRHHRVFQQFWGTVGEFDKERFRQGTILLKVYLIVKQPIDMILRILIPVVDMEKPLYGWSKLLFSLQVVLVPTYTAYIIVRGHTILGTAAYIVTLMIMVPVALIICFLTRTDTPPRFFRYTSVIGFLATVFLIYCLTSEVNAMFFTLATVLKVSQEFALATVICWAMYSNDLVANIALAYQGWPRMAFTATFSSPVFGTFVVLALPLIVEAFLKAPAKINPSEGHFGETACIFVEVGLLFSMLAALTNNFKMRRACGFLLVSYYLFFFGVLVLLEKGVIHGYGVDG